MDGQVRSDTMCRERTAVGFCSPEQIDSIATIMHNVTYYRMKSNALFIIIYAVFITNKLYRIYFGILLAFFLFAVPDD